MAKAAKKKEPLFDGADWTFETLRSVYDAIEDVATNDLKLDFYTNQIEIISSEQMLDAYSSIGMPLMYRHWSFGKHFVTNERYYRKGAMGLAYEIVINSDPCISYCMEENSMPMQTLVMAHAAFGHNHFFKANHLFQQWTDAGGILDYLEFARGYIAECEENPWGCRGRGGAGRRSCADDQRRVSLSPAAGAVLARGTAAPGGTATLRRADRQLSVEHAAGQQPVGLGQCRSDGAQARTASA